MRAAVTRPAPTRAGGVDLAIAAVLVGALVAVYAPVGGHEFLNYDDDEYVTANPAVRAGLTPASIRWVLTSTHQATWHPLTGLSHLLDVELFGLDAGAHLWTNVALHAGAAVALFLVLRAMTAARWPSAFVAALFALHPLHVESVAWVSERKDVLSGLLWMLTLAAYAGWTRRPGRGRYLVLLAAFTLALLAKPMVVTLPFVLLLLDVWPLGRLPLGGGLACMSHQLSAASADAPAPQGRTPSASSTYCASMPAGASVRAALRHRRLHALATKAGETCRLGARAWPLVREKLPLVAMAAALAAVTVVVQHGAGAVATLAAVPLGPRVANAVVAYAAYLRKTLWPSDLAAFYPFVHPLPAWRIAAAAAVLAAVSALVAAGARRRPYLLVGWLWYLGTLVPVLGLVRQGEQAMADRFTYLPLIGVFVMVAWGAAEWGHARRRIALAAAVVVAACALLAARQVHHWESSASLFRHALAVTSGNYLAHTNLGAALAEEGADAEALRHFEAAVRLAPGYAKAQMNLGRALAERGETAAAAARYAEALRLDPGLASAEYNWGLLLARQGELDAAIAHYERALALDPTLARAHVNLGWALAAQGRYEQAVRRYRAALALAPDLTAAHNNLAVALEALGRPAEARAHYARAVDLDPADARARCNLAAVLLAEGRAEEAVAHYRAAGRLAPDLVEAAEGLAAAEAAAGRFARAAAAAERAVALARRAGRTELADALAARRDAYRAGRLPGDPD